MKKEIDKTWLEEQEKKVIQQWVYWYNRYWNNLFTECLKRPKSIK
jgi:hypothetical protein